MSYKRQPGREIKSMPACVLNSDTFLSPLTAFFPFFLSCGVKTLSSSWWYWFMSPSEAIPSYTVGWVDDWFLLNKNISVIYFTTVLWSVHYYFRVTMATAKLLLLHVCTMEFQHSWWIFVLFSPQKFDSVLYHKDVGSHDILLFLRRLIRRTPEWFPFSPLQNTSSLQTLPEIGLVLFQLIIYLVRHSEQDERRTKERDLRYFLAHSDTHWTSRAPPGVRVVQHPQQCQVLILNH